MPSPITAIDILLEPDTTMLRHAEAVNSSHLKIFPQGFALDATHRPHITMLQRFVRTAELDQLYVAVQKVLSGCNVTGMKLEAFKYYYIPSNDLGLSGIVAKPTPELLKLQADLIAAVASFTVPSGNSDAFVTAQRTLGCVAATGGLSCSSPTTLRISFAAPGNPRKPVRTNGSGGQNSGVDQNLLCL